MKYRRYNNYGYSSRPYYTDRYKSDAYRQDGGANDEGYYYAYCDCCGKRTEHESRGECLSC